MPDSSWSRSQRQPQVSERCWSVLLMRSLTFVRIIVKNVEAINILLPFLSFLCILLK